MAVFNKKTIPERMVLHGLLIGFSMVFFFPFLWMICNSVKVQEEMSSERFKLFPRSPHVVDNTPYIDVNEFPEVEPLDGVPAPVWKKALPEIKKNIASRLKTWKPVLPGDRAVVVIPDDWGKDYRTAMIRGIFATLSQRISDTARDAANVENRRIYRGAKEKPGELHEDAIKFGCKAIIEDFDSKLDSDLLAEVFDRVFRRFCLGEIKVRIDYEVKVFKMLPGWRKISGDVTLVQRRFHNILFKLAEINYSKDNEAVFVYDLPVGRPERVNRFYVGFRGDASWSRVRFEVVKDGKIYNSSDIVNLHSRTWSEAELRWQGEKIDETERRTFLFLEDSGRTVDNKNLFQIRVKVKKSGILLAWYDKILRNYRTVFREVPFLRYIMTSLCICIINIVLTVFSCSLVAYAFSRLEWPGRKIFFAIMLATMMLPSQVIMIPGFLINRYLGLYNTIIPLWLFSAFGSAFFIFLLRQFMMTIPKDLEEAARIDGCGFFGIYWRVILPLIKPTIATIAIFTFTTNWNNFMGPLIYVNDERLFPLALGLFKFNLISSYVLSDAPCFTRSYS